MIYWGSKKINSVLDEDNVRSFLEQCRREDGGGFRMGNTCIPVADSF